MDLFSFACRARTTHFELYIYLARCAMPKPWIYANQMSNNHHLNVLLFLSHISESDGRFFIFFSLFWCTLPNSERAQICVCVCFGENCFYMYIFANIWQFNMRKSRYRQRKYSNLFSQYICGTQNANVYGRM